MKTCKSSFKMTVGTIIKDTWTIMAGRKGREVGRAGGWAGVGGEGRELYLNNN